MEPESSLPHSQAHATWPYPEPEKSKPWLPGPLFLISILMLSSHLRICLPSNLFSSVPLTETLYAPHMSPIHARNSAHFIPFDSNTQTIFSEEYRSLSSSLCSLLHFPVTSSLLGPNIPHRHILEELHATFLPVCDRPSFKPIQNYKQNYNSVYLNLYIFGWKGGRQIFCAECQHSLISICTWFLHELNFASLYLFPNIETVSLFQRVIICL